MKEQVINKKNIDKLNFQVIDNFQQLGTTLSCPARILSYVRKFKTERNMQTLVMVKDRKTYKSCKQLSAIQKAIKTRIGQAIFDTIEDTSHILAYKKGVNYRAELQDCVDNTIQINFDIKKCYDNITYQHIVNMLQHYGFTHRGAKLVAGYCVVKRTLHKKNKGDIIVNTLQQGSQCSPIISNLVLNWVLDEPLKAWLTAYIKRNELPISYKYYRYSDNVALFIKGNISLEFIKDYRNQYRSLLRAQNMWCHDEIVTKNNNPHRNQRFLGIVLNKIARIELKEFHKLRAILFNCCRNGLAIEGDKYLKEKMYELTFDETTPYDSDTIVEIFTKIMTGKIAYIKSINEKQYLQLKKLLTTATTLYEQRASGTIYYTQDAAPFTKLLREDIFEFIKKTYHNQNEDVGQYLLHLGRLVTLNVEDPISRPTSFIPPPTGTTEAVTLATEQVANAPLSTSERMAHSELLQMAREQLLREVERPIRYFSWDGTSTAPTPMTESTAASATTNDPYIAILGAEFASGRIPIPRIRMDDTQPAQTTSTADPDEIPF